MSSVNSVNTDTIWTVRTSCKCPSKSDAHLKESQLTKGEYRQYCTDSIEFLQHSPKILSISKFGFSDRLPIEISTDNLRVFTIGIDILWNQNNVF